MFEFDWNEQTCKGIEYQTQFSWNDLFNSICYWKVMLFIRGIQQRGKYKINYKADGSCNCPGDAGK